MADEKSYKSPTTPSLMVTFKDYVIELVCLNVRSSLSPRFWKDSKYWGPKYRREIKGVYNLRKQLGDFNDPTLRTAVINSVRKLNIKSLSAKKTIDRLAKTIRIEHANIIQHREQLVSRTQPQIQDVVEHSRRNAGFVDVDKKTKIATLRKIENRGKTKD